jgi:hypothetical protein
MPLPLDELVAQPSLVNLRAQQSDWDELLFEYELMLDDMQAWLRGLSDEQIHFKPADQQFSIAEIVTHGCFSDEMVWGRLALLAQGRDGEIDPKTLIGGAGARNDISRLDLEGRNEACRTLARNTIESWPDPADLATTAPHPYFGALNAKGWIYFMALHRGLHRHQAEQVIDAPGFPHSASVQTQPREAYQPAARKTWLARDAKGKKQEAGSKKQEAGGKKQEARGRKQEASGKHTATATKRTATKKTATKKK